jgi:hypothetical protein
MDRLFSILGLRPVRCMTCQHRFYTRNPLAMPAVSATSTELNVGEVPASAVMPASHECESTAKADDSVKAA